MNETSRLALLCYAEGRMAHLQHRLEKTSRRPAPARRFRLSSCSLAGVACLFISTAILLCLGGCGEPGSPQPPSLNLPVPVRNLAAQRTGDTIHLSWTTTDRTTDHTKPAGIITTRICRIQGSASKGLPNTTASTAALTPGANPGVPALCERVADERYRLGTTSTYDDILPMTMTSGDPSLLTYYVELLNHAQKSAGGSNPAYVAEGADLPALAGLTATPRAEGVLLRWDAANSAACPQCKIRIERLLTSAPIKAAKAAGPRSANPLGASAPSPRQTLELKEQSPAEALDRTAAFGQTYEYRARRVEAITLDGHPLELLGQQSAPVTIETRDTFPPAIPKDVAAAADSGSRAIDLSWTPDTEPDLAGYIVYRHIVRSDGITNDLLQRVSGPTPLPAPAFHDTQVQPGMKYAYSVSAVDQSGNESGRSVEAQETLAPPQ